MSKAARQSIIILVALVLGAFVFGGMTYLEKMKLAKENQSLQQQIEEFRLREQTVAFEKKQWEDKVKAAEAAKNELQTKLAGVDTNVQGFNDKIKSLTSESDDLRKQVETLTKERADLTAKLQEAPKEKVIEKIVYVDKKSEENAAAATSQPNASVSQLAAANPSAEITPPAASAPKAAPAAPAPEGTDEYWAGILKEKAALEVELENTKQELMHTQVDLADFKKQNSDLQLELTGLKNQKETIDRDIKRGQDLADNLSLELARAKNDSKYSDEKVNKINQENLLLREQIKNLTSTKIALEKSIVRLQDDKKDMERKLVQTENVVQNRIDEIWKIKNDLSKSFKSTSKNTNANQIELPPIVVSSHEDENGTMPAVGAAEDEKTDQGSKAGRSAVVEGNVVSINEDNNFVIVDLGEKSGIKIGDPLSVYRNSEYIAGLEIIQVRKDIAAADIKNKTSRIQVGDVVR